MTWVGVPSSGTPFVGYAVSSDGAQTFPVRGTVPTPGGRSADHPTLAADGQGNVYLAWLGYVEGANGARTDTHVYVAAAAGGATAFGDAVEASEPTGFTYSNPWITVTPMGSPLVTFQRSGMVDLGIVAARSADMGATWTTHVIATDTHLLNDRDLPSPCESATTGRLFVTYFSNDLALGRNISIGWSDDDGVTWSDPTQMSPITSFGEHVAFSPPRCVALETAVIVAFGETKSQSSNQSSHELLSSVMTNMSANDGMTFSMSPTFRVWVDGSNPWMSFLNPQLVADPNEVSYVAFDGNDGSHSAHTTGQLSLVQTTDTATIDLDLSCTDATRLGDYTGLAATTTTLYTSYVDNTSGASHIRVHAAPLP